MKTYENSSWKSQALIQKSDLKGTYGNSSWKSQAQNVKNGQKGLWKEVKFTCDIPTFQTVHKKPK